MGYAIPISSAKDIIGELKAQTTRITRQQAAARQSGSAPMYPFFRFWGIGSHFPVAKGAGIGYNK